MPMSDVIKLYNATQDKAIETKNKRAFLEQRKIDQNYDRAIEQLSKADEMKIDPEKGYKKGQIGTENEKYQEVIDRRLPFVNKALSMIVPVAAGSIYLIGGVTGGGKSTTVSNIIIPLLNEGAKVLVIANEERRNDVYSRVACHNVGQSFFKLKLGLLGPEIRKLIAEECSRLEEIMTVVGTDFQNNPDMVSTPEGLKVVFTHFAEGHDAILFDYYQNITFSTVDDRPEPWVHQATFASWLNLFKNGFNGPIFVMSQLMDLKEKGHASFKDRIEGRKSIANVAPVHIEIRPDKNDYATLFKIHKDRLTSQDGKGMRMGFDKNTGRFVPYNDEFKAKAALWIAERLILENSPEEQEKQAALKEGEMVDKLHSEGGAPPRQEGMVDELDFSKWVFDEVLSDPV